MKRLIALTLVLIMVSCASTGPVKDHHYYLRFLTFAAGWLTELTAPEVGIGNTPELTQVRRFVYDQYENWLEYSNNTDWADRYGKLYSALWVVLVHYKDQMPAQYYTYFSKRLATWQ